MTKKQEKERLEAIEQLKTWIKPGDTVYTILDHVSRSGMLRHIRVVVPLCSEGKPDGFVHPNYLVSKALGIRQAKRRDGLAITGCGMDMGYHLVNSLSLALYPEYECLGEKCPSSYHSNHRRSANGEERFDLLHTDGYALRHQWL